MTIIFWTAFGLFVGLAFWMFINLVLWDRAQWQEKQIAARADYQHKALLNGHTAIGVYGAFPPKVIH